MTNFTAHEQREIDRANAEGKQPVVFVHGLWLLSSSWDRWRALFEEQGYTTLAPGWPDDPETVEAANHDPQVFAHKRIQQVTQHYVDALGQLKRKPAVIGHSFGGLIAQKLAGEGVAAVTVAIDSAPYRGVLPLPLSSLKSASAVIGNPANYNLSVPLTYEQFRFAFANAVDEDEAQELYETFAVPASGEKDNTVPWVITHASYELQKHNPSVTEIREMPGRGHALTIDHGWRDVAETALTFITQQLQKHS